jgi:ferric-dicitrate binding protein FerR (iron transport regulator)
MRRQRSISLAVFALAGLSFSPSILANTTAPAQNPPSHKGISHARVVSLSLVEGIVIARMPGSTKWARASANAPIREGSSVATAKHSFAEVQFENGSTIRLGELSRIDFKQLALAPHSGHVNHLTLDVGFATIHVIPERHDDYVLNASGASLTPHGKTEFRADLSRGLLRVEVFNGRVQAADPSQSEKLGKNHVLACDYRAKGAFQVTGTIQMDEWDKWVRARDRQADLAGYDNQGAGLGGPLYGWDDLIPFGGMGQIPFGYLGDNF